MKTLIIGVTLQITQFGFTVFTDYKLHSTYNGFTPYQTIEEAQEAATKLVNTWDVNFMSTVKGYNVITFGDNGSKVESFVQVKK